MNNEDEKLNKVIDNLEECPICKAITNGDKVCHNCGMKLSECESDEKQNKEDIKAETKTKINSSNKSYFKVYVIVGVITSIVLVIIAICIILGQDSSRDNGIYDNTINILSNEEQNEKDNIYETERINLNNLGTATVKDFTMDNSYGISVEDDRFLYLIISRIECEKYSEDLYAYTLGGKSIIEPMNSQFAYKSLDTMLTDISWIGVEYNYLKTPNIYEPTWEYESSGPSPINGISQNEYEKILNGKYDNVQIIKKETEENSDITSDYIGNWADDNWKDTLIIKNISNNKVVFDFSIFRIGGYEDLVATIDNATKMASFNTNNTNQGEMWEGVYGTLEFKEKSIILNITKSECEYIHAGENYTFIHKENTNAEKIEYLKITDETGINGLYSSAGDGAGNATNYNYKIQNGKIEYSDNATATIRQGTYEKKDNKIYVTYDKQYNGWGERVDLELINEELTIYDNKELVSMTTNFSYFKQ